MEDLGDEAIRRAEMCDSSKEIPLAIINQLDYGQFKNIVLKDAEINSILMLLKDKSINNPNCTRQQQQQTSSSMVTFVSGHGNDLDVATRHTIIDAVLTLEFKFPELNYDNGENGSYKYFESGKQIGEKRVKKSSYLDILVPEFYKTESAFRKAFEKYIEKSVYLQIAMGEPGPSAPMSMAEKQSCWVAPIGICGEQDVCLAEYSSSEVDIFIVANAYSLLYNNRIEPTDCDLIEFNRVIRHILRANFIDIWDEKPKDQRNRDELWKKHYLKLVADTKKNLNKPDIYKPKIWVLKRISKSSFDRYYQLKPNEGEEPEYRVHEGLHIFDWRETNGQQVEEVPDVVDFNEWKATLKNEKNPEALDKNNLKTTDFSDKFFDKVKIKFPVIGIDPESKKNKAIRRAIAGILYSIEKEELYLSEICLLGFLLKIDMFTLYDPACRPITHTIEDEKGVEILSTTRSGLVRPVDEVYDILDQFLTQSSQ